jgi:hypothetical protein
MDLNKLIQDNLLISLIVIIVPIVAVAWKIMETLFIKPREFRINILEKDLEKLRNEFLRIDKQQGEKILPEGKHSKTTIMNKENEPHIKKVENQIVSSNYLNTLHELYSGWRDKNLTDLQRKRFENDFSGKEVIWDVYVTSISESENERIYLGVAHDIKENYHDNAVAFFDSKDEEALALLGKGDKIRIKGTIERFFLMPSLKNCKLLDRLKE